MGFMDLSAIREKETRYGIGLMSGSSCDGVDTALVRINGTGPGLGVRLIGFQTIPYPGGFRRRLLAHRKNAQEVCSLNFALGELLAQAAADMVERARERELSVDFIASHGHTLSHLPPNASDRGTGTLQIGEPALIAERTGIPVVSGFRPRDMAAGGQGAPLVPYADWILFHRDDRTAVCLNIGGIANVTVVAPTLESVVAFDTGPGNMIIDGAMRMLTRGEMNMDEYGQTAAKGSVDLKLLERLLDHPYFAQRPPKSAGREQFGPEVFLRDAIVAHRSEHSLEDFLATVTTVVAKSITQAIDEFVAPTHEVSRIIVSGGGAHNRTLIRLLEESFPGGTVRRSDQYGLPSDAREAIAFAILGNETLCGTPANVPSATGASHPVVLGSITPP